MFGRGTGDMKGGLASMLYAAVALQRLRVPLLGRLGLVFVPDEETGGQRGSSFLAAAKRLGSHGIGMLTPEPTSGVVWNANRGAFTVRVTVHGREAHVGLLHQGRNVPGCGTGRVGPAAAGPARGPPSHGVLRNARRGAPIADAHRRTRRGRIELQRRAGALRLHRRSEDESRRRPRRGARCPLRRLRRRAARRRDAGRGGHPGRPSVRDLCRYAARSSAEQAGPGGDRPGTKVRDVSRSPGDQVLHRARNTCIRGRGLLAVAHGPREFVHTGRIVECAAIYARMAATILGRA